MLARAAVLIVLVLAVAAAGCGSADDGHSDYIKALNTAQTGLRERFTQLGARITPTSTPQQDQRTLKAYEDVVDTTVKDLRGVEPPDGFGALHRRFVAQIAGYGSALRAARDGIDSDRPRTILAAQSRLRDALSRTGRRLNATIEAINKKIKD